MEKVSQHLIYIHRRWPILETSTSPAGQSLLRAKLLMCGIVQNLARLVVAYFTHEEKNRTSIGPKMCFKGGWNTTRYTYRGRCWLYVKWKYLIISTWSIRIGYKYQSDYHRSNNAYALVAYFRHSYYRAFVAKSKNAFTPIIIFCSRIFFFLFI